MKYVETKNAPKAIGPYSQGIIIGNLVYTSGQLGLIPEDGVLPLGVVEQTHQACRNVGEILKAAGSDFSKVIKTTVFVADLKDFSTINEIYASYFISKPARSCVEVKALPKNALLEIEAIAEV